MKKLFFTLSLLAICISCKEPKSEQIKSEIKDSNTETISKKNPEPRIQLRSLTTRSGKIIKIHEEMLSSSLSNIRIDPQGFPESNETIKLEETDPISQVFIRDLDRNKYDELYVITQSAGSGTYATIYGYASNKDKSISPIYVPEIAQSDFAPDAVFHGYRGHDSIYLSKKRLLRKFPVFKENDKNCCPTGGTRTIRYKLEKGEATWRLEVAE